MQSFLNLLTRRKPIQPDAPSRLVRVCTLWDLLAVGIGGTFGIGVFVLPGEVARKYAGPAVILSITIAAFACFIACLCFAEFAVRIPRVGSAYIYSYVTVGEFVAFIIGWTMIIEFLIAVASLSRGLSTHIDNLSGGVITYHLSKWIPMHIPFLAAFPDLLALGLLLVLHAILLTGAKTSTFLLRILTTISLILVTVLMFLGFTYSDPSNWNLQIPGDYIPLRHGMDPGPGSGGFVPFGIRGIIRGAAVAFFGFVGINNVVTMSEEAKNPHRDIPLSILISCLVISTFYVSAGIGLTMMLPYYQLDPVAPYLSLLEKLDLFRWRWFVAIGAVFSISASLFSNVIGLPRLMYAVAHDGLLFAVLKKVSKKTKVPYVSIIVCSIFSGLMALFFDLYQLMELISLICLGAYTVVAICVILLRYRNDDSSLISFSSLTDLRFKRFFYQIFNTGRTMIPTNETYLVVKLSLALYLVWCFVICVWDSVAWDLYDEYSIFVILTTTVLLLVLILFTVPIRCQPEIYTILAFKVFWLPFIPCLSIFCNVYLMSQMIVAVWIEILILAVIGYVFYFVYGMRNSVLGANELAVSSSLFYT